MNATKSFVFAIIPPPRLFDESECSDVHVYSPEPAVPRGSRDLCTEHHHHLPPSPTATRRALLPDPPTGNRRRPGAGKRSPVATGMVSSLPRPTHVSSSTTSRGPVPHCRTPANHDQLPACADWVRPALPRHCGEGERDGTEKMEAVLPGIGGPSL